MTVLYLAGQRPQEGRLALVLRILGLALPLAVTAVVALAVIALRWHYFTDTVAGAAVGLGTVCAVALVLDSQFIRCPLTQETGEKR